MRQFTYSKDAWRTLMGLPTNTAARIRAKIAQYAADPASVANNVRALKGQRGYLRLRIGDWRVIMTSDGTIVAIIEIAARGSVYD